MAADDPFSMIPPEFLKLLGAAKVKMDGYLQRLSPIQRDTLYGVARFGAEQLADHLGKPPKASKAATSRPRPSQRQRDLATLGLAEGATEAEIKAAYRQLAKAVHPDHGGDPKKMAEINLAYRRLLQPVKTA